MTPVTETRLSPEEVCRRGQEFYERCIKPLLTPEDRGKFVVVDVATEEYEVSANEWDAVDRLTARRRGSQLWVVRVDAPYRMSYRMRFGQ